MLTMLQTWLLTKVANLQRKLRATEKVMIWEAQLMLAKLVWETPPLPTARVLLMTRTKMELLHLALRLLASLAKRLTPKSQK
jgi:hypothetical protein